MEKRGQEQLSFGMIFSIILIIFFIVFAFYAIQKFLVIGNTAKIAGFTGQLESDIDKMWRGIEYICFADYNAVKKGPKTSFYDELNQVYFESENFFFYPVGSSEMLNSKEIKHIDIEKITKDENPYCIKNIEGKIEITIKKDFGEALVAITK